MRILVDMDDVLEILSQHWIDVLNERCGTSFTRDDMVCWNLDELFEGRTRDEIYAPLNEEGFWSGVEPMPGGPEAIQSLLYGGHEVFVVTNSSYHTLKEKMEQVLFKYYPMLSWNNVVVTYNKSIVQGDILIDDAVHNILCEYGNNNTKYSDDMRIKVLFDAPWNRSFNAEAHGAYRVHNWQEAMELIHKIERMKEENTPRGVGVKVRK